LDLDLRFHLRTSPWRIGSLSTLAASVSVVTVILWLWEMVGSRLVLSLSFPGIPILDKPVDGVQISLRTCKHNVGVGSSPRVLAL